jgi:CheY-like chemotaxis protein
LISANPKVQLKVDFDSKKLPQKFLGDSLRIRQVLINLLSNAIKFTEQGTITVKVSLEQNISNIPWLFQKNTAIKRNESLDSFDNVARRRPGSVDKLIRPESPKSSARDTRAPLFLVFSVADTGIGIEPGIIAKLFDAFEQADSSTSKKYGGSGLGLAICKNICKLHGGDIAAESGGKDRGSTFYFYVPFIEVAEDNLSTSISEITNLNKYPVTMINIDPANSPVGDLDPVKQTDAMNEETVLLAEDNKVSQLIIRTMLSKLNYKVDIANNGAEAVELMQQKNYSIVFMDIEMPILSK